MFMSAASSLVLYGLTQSIFQPAAADDFNVYCVPSLDGVSTCSGWSDGGTLTCISSPGGVASCRSTTGRQFTCVQDSGGVTTCQNPSRVTGSATKGDNCVYIGNGSFQCEGKPKNSPQALPGTKIIIDSKPFKNDSIDFDIPSLIP
jgi:hypothetical protein